MVVNVRTPQTDYFERSETLVRYYEEIRRFNILTPEQEIALFKIVQNGNPSEKKKAKEMIINCNQRFVVAVAKRFATNDNLLDLINEGNIGLIESIDSFKLSKNVKFTTWAVWYIRRAINLYCINSGSMVRKHNISKTYHVISSATNRFMQEECRQPTLEELAEILNEKYDLDIKDLSDIFDTNISSIDESFGSEDDDTNIGDMNLFNSYSASKNDYEKDVEADFNKKMIGSLLTILTPREQTIIKMSFGIGYDREYELAEIGDKMKLTTERVRQMKISSIERLSEEYKKRLSRM